jgi:DNA-binding CsgD family transcriptional regulator
VETVVARALDGPVEGATLHYLWEASRGNALYLRELVRHGVESGALVREQGLWHWPGRRRAGERLHDLVALRMGTLADDERDTLELVTVGEPLSAAALRFLGVTEIAERLERRGLVMSDPDLRETSLAHPLFGEVVRQAMPSTRLDDIRLRLADALEATSPDRDADRFRITLWRLDGGDRSRPENLVAAAFRAHQLWEVDIAERLARAALESGPDFEAGMLLAGALGRRGDTERALEVYVGLHDVPDDDQQLARLATVEASVRFFHLGQAEEAHRLLADALARVTDEQARQRLHAEMRLLGLPPAQSVTDTEPSNVLSALGAALDCVNAGQLELAVRTVDAAFEALRDELERDPLVTLFLRMARTWARAFAGAVEHAEQTANLEYLAAVSRRADYPRVSWCLTRGRLAILRGRAHEAVHALQEGVVLMGSDDRGYQRPMHAFLAMAFAMTGDVESAREHARAADDASRILDLTFGTEVACAQASVLAVEGELSAAIDACAAAADLAVSKGHWLWEAVARHDLARYGHSTEAAVRLGELAVTVDGPLVDALAMHARALADDDGPALDAASVRFADLALTLFAAEASSAAVHAHRHHGKKGSAYASRERALELAAACEFACTPTLAGFESVDELTGREREVAELAASGLSSRRIAERLGITARTVDNLLGRVYTKLGISGRQELTELLGTTRRE